MLEIIQKAIQCGYPDILSLMDTYGGIPNELIVIAFNRCILDRFFWQALYGDSIKMDMYDIVQDQDDDRWGYRASIQPLWKFKMVQGMGVIADGGSIIGFLKSK